MIYKIRRLSLFSRLYRLFFLLLVLMACSGIVTANNDKHTPAEFIVHRDLAYIANSADKLQTLDIYIPENTPQNAPVHVYVHGGGWTKGDKSMLTPEQISAYTKQGIILVSVNYRLGPEHQYPANVQDIVAASHWLKNTIAHYSGDPSNMVLSGHSAGGHLVALFGVGTADITQRLSQPIYKAIIPVDTASYDLTRRASGRLAGWVNRQKRLAFGRNQRVLKRASPLLQIERGVHYSLFDLYVTQTRADAVQETQQFARRLQAAGHSAQATIITGGLSHAQMKKAMFNPQHKLFSAIVAHLM